MNVIFVEQEFQEACDEITNLLPIRLGGVRVKNGENYGKLLVNCAILNSCIEWEILIQEYVSGGTAITPNGFVIEAGRTVEFARGDQKFGPYEIQEITQEELNDILDSNTEG